jgi:hypothetical protein
MQTSEMKCQKDLNQTELLEKSKLEFKNFQNQVRRLALDTVRESKFRSLVKGRLRDFPHWTIQ